MGEELQAGHIYCYSVPHQISCGVVRCTLGVSGYARRRLSSGLMVARVRQNKIPVLEIVAITYVHFWARADIIDPRFPSKQSYTNTYRAQIATLSRSAKIHVCTNMEHAAAGIYRLLTRDPVRSATNRGTCTRVHAYKIVKATAASKATRFSSSCQFGVKGIPEKNRYSCMIATATIIPSGEKTELENLPTTRMTTKNERKREKEHKYLVRPFTVSDTQHVVR